VGKPDPRRAKGAFCFMCKKKDSEEEAARSGNSFQAKARAGPDQDGEAWGGKVNVLQL